MSVHPRLLVGLCVGTVLGAGIGGAAIATGQGDDGGGSSLTARAEIRNAAGKRIGEATFRQQSKRNQPTPVVEVEVSVKLPPAPLGPDRNRRGFHIHERANCTATNPAVDFSGAGGHFDPGPFSNTTPVELNHPYHLGDLPNLRREGDTFRLDTPTTRFTLEGNHATSIFDGDGAAVIVHRQADVQGPGQPPGAPGVPASGTAGGARDGCGEVRRGSGGDDDDDDGGGQDEDDGVVAPVPPDTDGEDEEDEDGEETPDTDDDPSTPGTEDED